MRQFLDMVPIPRRSYRLANTDGEGLLYNQQTMALVHLNESATVIWQLCDGRRTVEEIVDILRSAYPGQTHRLETETHDAIREFDAHDMLDWG